MLSVTQVHAGETWNVLPERAVLRGTTARFARPSQDALEAAIDRIAPMLPTRMTARRACRLSPAYPATVNSAAESERAGRAAATVVGGDGSADAAPSMGAEDFAFMLAERPGCYVWLGGGRGRPEPGLHNPHSTSTTEFCRSAPATGSLWSNKNSA